MPVSEVFLTMKGLLLVLLTGFTLLESFLIAVTLPTVGKRLELAFRTIWLAEKIRNFFVFSSYLVIVAHN
jgi:hypothetical protein